MGKHFCTCKKHTLFLIASCQILILCRCELCPAEFKTRSELMSHMGVHKSKSYSCLVCSKSFAKKESLDSHMLKVHGSDWKPCYFCKRKFRSIQSLKAHMRKCSLRPREVLTLSCLQCREVFKTKRQLDRHMKTHTVRRIT